MKRLEEKAQLEFNYKTVGKLIEVLEDIHIMMGKDTKNGVELIISNVNRHSII
jgi:hypothetical protein